MIWDGTVHIYTIIFHFCIVCAALSVLFLSKLFLFILFQAQGVGLFFCVALGRHCPYLYHYLLFLFVLFRVQGGLTFCGDGNNIGVMKMFGLFFTTTTTTPLGV